MNHLSYLNAIAWKALLVSVLLAAGCSDHSHDAEHAHDHAGHVHSHEAPHGGALVMLGNHLAQLELVWDASEGKLSLYCLDGEAENFVRIAAPQLSGTATVDGVRSDLVFAAVADARTGETVGDSSHFATRVAWGAEVERFEVVLDAISIRGQDFKDLALPYPDGAH